MQGIHYNIEQNNLDDSNIKQLSSLDDLPENLDIILYKIPKIGSFNEKIYFIPYGLGIIFIFSCYSILQSNL
jgi:hypothetical protein